MAALLARIVIAAIVAVFLTPVAKAQDPAEAKPATRRPNIVFILADELGVNELGCYGSKEHKTPNIDKLAERGVRFTNAYASAPDGPSTESAILTGQINPLFGANSDYYRPNDVVGHLLRHPEPIAKSKSDLRTTFQSHGYKCDTWRLFGTWLERKSESGNEIDKYAANRKNSPFFMYVRFDQYFRLNGESFGIMDVAQVHELAEKAGEKDLQKFCAIERIKRIDGTVGKIVTKLDELDIAKDTIVVFTSDSGGSHFDYTRFVARNSPYRAGNGFLYEGGVRVPLIAFWPGRIQPGGVDKTPVISSDMPPTLLASAGIAPTEKAAGVNLTDLLFGQKPPSPRPLYWHFPYYSYRGGRPAGAIREGQWKLIEHYETGSCELFDIDRDAGETVDLAAKEPGRVADLRGKLEKWRRDTGAKELSANPNFNRAIHRDLFEFIDVSRIAAEADQSKLPELKSWRDRNFYFDWLMARNTMSGGTGRWEALQEIERKKFDNRPKPGAGAIILSAKNAKVHGDKLRYEPQPQKDTLGFWVNKDDWLEWTFTAPHKGTFDVEVLQACGKGSGGAEIEIAIGEQKLTMKVEETGHFQRFIPRTIGQVTLDDAAPTTLTVRAKTKPGPAVMDLRRIVLKDAVNKSP